MPGVGVTTVSYTTGFGDSLATVARKLGEQLPTGAWDVAVSGRVLSLERAHGGDFTATLNVLPQSLGSAVVTPQLVFTTTDWNQAQTVIVRALDDDFVDGSDALVFPALEGRVNGIRGPLVIDGGIRVGEERFLGNPLLLPGEKNLPLPQGEVTGTGTAADGLAFLTDASAMHVNARTGERPGFDPRMNDFAFIATFLTVNHLESVLTLDVASVSADILSVAKATAFSVAFQVAAGGSAEFIGTPVQTGLGGLDWTRMVVTLDGVARVGETWRLTVDLDGTASGGPSTTYSVPIGAGEAVLSSIAERLADAIRTQTPALDVEVRVGILGDSRLILTKTDGTRFNATFSVLAAPGETVEGGATLGGTLELADVGLTTWTQAAFRILSAGTGTWSIALGGAPAVTYPVQAGDTVADVTGFFEEGIDSAYAPLVSGTRVTLRTGWPTGTQPVAEDLYFVAPFNLNFRVIEDDQVDALYVDNTNSPADDVGVLTDSRITGLGMGGTTVVAGRLVPGGITYSNLEVVSVGLGRGNDHFTVETTHAGSTTVRGGAGNDTIAVETIVGHATIETGAGDDTVTVANDEQNVDQITGLLTVDMGAGEDTLVVDDSGDAVDDTTLDLTASTLTGLDMPTVAEVQTVFVQAASGTYRLRTPGYGTETGLPDTTTDFVERGAGFALVTLDYGMDDEAVAERLRALYGFDDLKVSSIRTGVDVTHRVTFIRGQAGVDHAPLEWGETRETTGLVAGLGASTDVRVATLRDGALTTERDTVQTLTVDATGGSFVLHFVRANAEGVAQDFATAPIAFNASAAAVLEALSAVLNPNNANPALPFTDNVAVEQHGTTYHLGFRGEHRDIAIAFVDVSALLGTVAVATRLDGINYYGVDLLDVRLGSDDVVNVTGTSAVTNLDLGDGDEWIYVSSAANVAMGETPAFLSGHLGTFLGTLNIDAGTGRHQLMISNEASAAGRSVLITDSLAAAAAVDPNVASDAEIFIVGLAPAGITFRADAAGDFARGITIWTGSGADVLTVDGTHFRPAATEGGQPVETVTTLNTGLGNDVVTVSLQAADDGRFVLNTQGQYSVLVPVAAGLNAAGPDTPADLVSVAVDGVALTADQVSADFGLDRIGLLVSPLLGASVEVEIVRTVAEAFTFDDAAPVLHVGEDLQPGVTEVVGVSVNGVDLADLDGVVVDPAADTVTFTAAATPPAGALVVVRMTKRITETSAVGAVTDDEDTVLGTGSTPEVDIGTNAVEEASVTTSWWWP